ncbi:MULTISPECIES: RCC1 domain-containing protein [Chryseobacterium]|uniref:RCC1 domain-containing protein n=1 Tax=Chryseobacterium TaxID=59732 RepID=UPI000E75D7F4|nr:MULTISPECIES: T9SS type A sorting domain-containing protein [Chryseobacterium]MCD9616088.1 T9SS type A sorting domain-containing protein [Chryseobacterium gleum]QRA41351.1 T9SS type A sorting domain-containing protein [Chryseobacterium cucumeris]RKE81696.1 putative secreted protein (Por secretion system target) [Chryseobacterium sp. AG363]
MKNKFIYLSVLSSMAVNSLLFGQCFKKISTQWETVIALNEDGNIWEWGSNNDGQLGLGTYNYTDKNIPFQLTTSNDWKDVISSHSGTMALKNDGTLWGWGYGGHGELGNNSASYVFIPSPTGTNEWDRIFAGLFTNCGIKTNGTLWMWGTGFNGQLGNGATPINTLVPVQVGTDTDWKLVAMGQYHTIALKNNGTLWAWGGNALGQLGIGNNIDVSIPHQIGTENDWKAISTTIYHNLALKTNGTLWAWGGNAYGEIGDGSTVPKNMPIQIGNDNNWKAIETSSYGSFAIKNDGSLWAWGDNSLGQLGDGTTISRSVPVKIGNSNDWKSIECGGGNCIGTKQDNSLWTWGFNDAGQLGNGTFVNSGTPSMIMNACSFLGTKNSISSDQNIIIYPNPVSDILYFSKEIKNLKIYTVTGILIKNILNVNSRTINLQPLHSGIYFIDALTTEGNNMKEKIIKK